MRDSLKILKHRRPSTPTYMFFSLHNALLRQTIYSVSTQIHSMLNNVNFLHNYLYPGICLIYKFVQTTWEHELFMRVHTLVERHLQKMPINVSLGKRLHHRQRARALETAESNESRDIKKALEARQKKKEKMYPLFIHPAQRGLFIHRCSLYTYALVLEALSRALSRQTRCK